MEKRLLTSIPLPGNATLSGSIDATVESDEGRFKVTIDLEAASPGFQEAVHALMWRSFFGEENFAELVRTNNDADE